MILVLNGKRLTFDAYSGRIGHLIRDYTGHLSERSDADIHDLQKWPIRVKNSVSSCPNRSPV